MTSMSTVLESKKLVCGKSWGQTDLHMDTSGVTHTLGGGHSQVTQTGWQTFIGLHILGCGHPRGQTAWVVMPLGCGSP